MFSNIYYLIYALHAMITLLYLTIRVEILMAKSPQKLKTL